MADYSRSSVIMPAYSIYFAVVHIIKQNKKHTFCTTPINRQYYFCSEQKTTGKESTETDTGLLSQLNLTKERSIEYGIK